MSLESQSSLLDFDKKENLPVKVPVINVKDDSLGEAASFSGTLPKDRPGIRKQSMAVLVPRTPVQYHGSTESINQSPQSSPSYDAETTMARLPDAVPISNAVNLSRKESYKDQRRKYRTEKKRVAKELLSTLKDPSIIVLADWLKVRGTLKGWTKLWCVLKPGMLLLYKSSKGKSSHWTGTVLLNTCELIERPSKKDGFCFKLFHPLEQSIWATKGPQGETIGAMVQPLPSSHLIFRAPSQAAGKCWMDALELALRCSSILLRSMTSKSDSNSPPQTTLSISKKWNESDYEKHFKDQDPSDESSPGFSPDLSPTSSPVSVLRDCDPFQANQICSTHTTPVRSKKSSRMYGSCSPLPLINSAVVSLLHSPLLTKDASIKRDPSPTPYYQKLAATFALVDQELKETQLVAKSPKWNDEGCLNYLNYSSPRSPQLDRFNFVSPKVQDTCTKTVDLDDTSHTDEYEPQRDSGHFMTAEPISGSESDSEDEGSGKNEFVLDYDEDFNLSEESSYVHQPENYIGDTGEQTEELAEENKSLIWFLLKQVRPGMDLSKVVLPTFILEPRSFLDKLSDYYYHADLLSKAVQEDDPFTRMKEVVRWYLSGFYKKPKGLKKPYNPILGETFRCYWKHSNDTRTFYVAEQVSHHPPVSALYVTNRQEGFSISATILAKSKFYGNSTSALLDGNARLTLLPRGEDYIMNMPYAHCKGILMGTLTMELGGKVNIECEKTGYMAELEFKLKPFLSGMDASNLLYGKLKLGKETLATIEGRWDRKISMVDKRTGDEEILWEVNKETKESRLPRYTVSLDQQGDWESEKLWNLVSLAIKSDDQVAATEEKTILEEAQRTAARERKAICEEWTPNYFIQDPIVGIYMYRYSDLRPWDNRTDLLQYESDYKVTTRTRLKAPMIRTASIVSVELQKCESGRMSALDSKQRLRGVKEVADRDETSSGEPELQDAVEYPSVGPVQFHKERKYHSSSSLVDTLDEVKSGQENLAKQVKELRHEFENLQRRLNVASVYGSGDSRRNATPPEELSRIGPLATHSWASILVALILHAFLQWLLGWLWL